MDLRSFVELTDFPDLVWTATQSDGEHGSVRTDPFSISWKTGEEDRLRTYWLTIGCSRIVFSAEMMEALGDLLRKAVSTPEMREQMERLALVYGRL